MVIVDFNILLDKLELMSYYIIFRFTGIAHSFPILKTFMLSNSVKNPCRGGGADLYSLSNSEIQKLGMTASSLIFCINVLWVYRVVRTKMPGKLTVTVT